MPQYTDAKKRSNKKWDDANLDRVSIAMPKGKKGALKEKAEGAGMSVNAYAVQKLFGEELPHDAVLMLSITEPERKALIAALELFQSTATTKEQETVEKLILNLNYIF